MQKFRSLGYGLILFLSASSFAQEYPQLKLPQKKISFCGKSYLAWVAKTEEDRQRGFMNFRPLKANEAMIFEFPSEEPLSFWMKNVPFDLDIAYFSKEKKLLSYMTMKGTSPMQKEFSLPNYSSQGPAMYAVEVRAGTLKNLKKGCQLSFH